MAARGSGGSGGFDSGGSFGGRWALITGATSGIGLAIAELLAEQGCHLILTGRREERLMGQAKRLADSHGIKTKTLAFDIQDRAACVNALDSIETELKQLTILVNNAGLALGAEPLADGKMDDWDAMIDTNIKGLLYVTRKVLPYMIEQDAGHIVNMGSVAGRWTYAGGAVYCATKFAVRAMTDSLRMELQGKRIRVSNIEPGMVETGFSEVRFKGDKAKAANVYRGVESLSARDIAETVVWCLDRPPHVNIQELVIFPTDQVGVGPHYVHRRS